MRRAYLIFPAYLLCLPVMLSTTGSAVSATTGKAVVNCYVLLAKWKKLPDHRAFAVSHTYTGVSERACGWASGAQSKAAAESAALRACQSTSYSGCHLISAK